ncbi:MAG TPA: Gfo/Idh/MocA family oxidoreductase [Longimicrobiales bacterium]|nr:Gfo/Idh/MocA family oxidoreductase [Longimicrobiales bacterium]
MTLERPLRYGMIGGGPGAFIGAVHRRAAALDGLAELAAGAFSSDAEKSAAQGRELRLDPARVYPSWQAMAESEAEREEDRLDFVAIVTPNHLHHPVACAFLERGFHVVCDKPLATTLEDAEDLCRLVAESGLVFALTHNYTGYPMIKQARAMVAAGTLGPLRRVSVEYVQDWLAFPIERDGQKQAAWRTDPERAGAGALGDIGTHAENVARYVTGLAPERMAGDVATLVPGRRVEDDASLLIRYAGDARGVLTCSQVATGEENELTLRVYGTEGSLVWTHRDPNTLRLRKAGGAERLLRRGSDDLVPAAARAARLPAGHPEGFLEAFANVYANALRTIAARAGGAEPDPLDLDFPTVRDGAIGVHFVETALRAGATDGWVDAAYTPPG